MDEPSSSPIASKVPSAENAGSQALKPALSTTTLTGVENVPLAYGKHVRETVAVADRDADLPIDGLGATARSRDHRSGSRS